MCSSTNRNSLHFDFPPSLLTFDPETYLDPETLTTQNAFLFIKTRVHMFQLLTDTETSCGGFVYFTSRTSFPSSRQSKPKPRPVVTNSHTQNVLIQQISDSETQTTCFLTLPPPLFVNAMCCDVHVMRWKTEASTSCCRKSEASEYYIFILDRFEQHHVNNSLHDECFRGLKSLLSLFPSRLP